MPIKKLPSIGIVAGIYRIVNRVNGKAYIGSAVNIHTRWRFHVSSLRRGTHHAQPLQRAWVKYGEDAFDFEVIEVTEPIRDALISAEQRHMDAYGRNKYNASPVAGSPLGFKHSEETKAKVGAASRRNLARPEVIAAIVDKVACVWIVERPDGSRVTIKNLNQFCAANNLSSSVLSNVAAGRAKTHKGWRAWREGDPEPVFQSRGPRSNSGRKPKTRTFISPQNERLTITDLQAFCLERGLTYDAMCSVHTGKQYEHQGWRSAENRDRPIGGSQGKRYRMTHIESGRVLEIQNMAQFCRDEGIGSNNFDKVVNGHLAHYKGWYCEKL